MYCSKCCRYFCTCEDKKDPFLALYKPPERSCSVCGGKHAGGYGVGSCHRPWVTQARLSAKAGHCTKPFR